MIWLCLLVAVIGYGFGLTAGYNESMRVLTQLARDQRRN